MKYLKTYNESKKSFDNILGRSAEEIRHTIFMIESFYFLTKLTDKHIEICKKDATSDDEFIKLVKKYKNWEFDYDPDGSDSIIVITPDKKEYLFDIHTLKIYDLKEINTTKAVELYKKYLRRLNDLGIGQKDIDIHIEGEKMGLL